MTPCRWTRRGSPATRGMRRGEDRYVAEDGVDLVDVDWEVCLPFSTLPRGGFRRAAGGREVPVNMHSHEPSVTAIPNSALPRSSSREGGVSRPAPHACANGDPLGVAMWDEGREELTYYGAARTAHILRTTLAGRLGLSENQVRVISPDVGGGFGQKLPLYREEFTVAAMAMRLKRPIKWVEDRLENLTASNHARDDAVSVEVAVLNDGTILGVRADLWAASAPTLFTRQAT